MKHALQNCDSNIDSVGIFIGPEGGFSEEEIEQIQRIIAMLYH